MNETVFNETVIRALRKIPENYKLPGYLDQHSVDLITRIFIEQYSIYVKVLNWNLHKKVLIHIATFVWKYFKNEITKYYLNDRLGFEKLTHNSIELYEYSYSTIEDLFFEFCTLLNPFIKGRNISQKENIEVENLQKERKRKISDTKSHSTQKMKLIVQTVKIMKDQKCNYNYALTQAIRQTTNNFNSLNSDKSTILSWAKNQKQRHNSGLKADDYELADELLELKEKYKHKKPEKI